MPVSQMAQDFLPRIVAHPTIKDMEGAIRLLDAQERSMVTFSFGGDDEHHMGVGGGAGQYIVYITTDNMQFKNLTIPGKTGPKVLLISGGQEGEFEPKYCVDLDSTLEAVKWFALTGEPN